MTPMCMVHNISKAVGVLDSVPSAQKGLWISHRKEKASSDLGKQGLPGYQILSGPYAGELAEDQNIRVLTLKPQDIIFNPSHKNNKRY